MRLIHTASLRLEEFFDENLPIYAILSHTWEKEEITFQEMQRLDEESEASPTTKARIRSKAGYEKVRKACEVAKDAGWRYMWIDTCCIDKMSSVELREAINSMYKWDKGSRMCYAYLADIPYDGAVSLMGTSRWFTRGWTLQELIAPSNLEFRSREWISIGTKSKLAGHLSTITGIDSEVLGGNNPLSCSVARRMFWASKRKTTRLEDTAYCLLGLFDVNIPLMYGEGQKSFIRLQEAIMQVSSDHSLFAWKTHRGYNKTGSDFLGGLLAPSPSYFSASKNIAPVSGGNWIPYQITNIGYGLDLPLLSIQRVPRGGGNQPTSVVMALLDCADEEKHIGPEVIILSPIDLENRGHNWLHQRFLRDHSFSLPAFAAWKVFQGRELLKLPRTPIYIERAGSDVNWRTKSQRSKYMDDEFSFQVQITTKLSSHYKIRDIAAWVTPSWDEISGEWTSSESIQWYPETGTLVIPGQGSYNQMSIGVTSCILYSISSLDCKSQGNFLLTVTFDKEGMLVTRITQRDGLIDLGFAFEGTAMGLTNASTSPSMVWDDDYLLSDIVVGGYYSRRDIENGPSLRMLDDIANNEWAALPPIAAKVPLTPVDNPRTWLDDSVFPLVLRKKWNIELGLKDSADVE